MTELNLKGIELLKRLDAMKKSASVGAVEVVETIKAEAEKISDNEIIVRVTL